MRSLYVLLVVAVLRVRAARTVYAHTALRLCPHAPFSTGKSLRLVAESVRKRAG